MKELCTSLQQTLILTSLQQTLILTIYLHGYSFFGLDMDDDVRMHNMRSLLWLIGIIGSIIFVIAYVIDSQHSVFIPFCERYANTSDVTDARYINHFPPGDLYYVECDHHILRQIAVVHKECVRTDKWGMCSKYDDTATLFSPVTL